jgi:septum site-determining protein MinD
VVPDDEKIVVSTNRGEPVVTDNNSLAGQAYRNMARRLTGEQVPMLNIETENGFIDKLKKLFGLKTT